MSSMRRITMRHQKWQGCFKEIEQGMGAADWLIAGYAVAMGTLLVVLLLKGG